MSHKERVAIVKGSDHKIFSVIYKLFCVKGDV